MDHSIDMGPDDWTDWLSDYDTLADEKTKLAALRNYIEREARRALNSGGSNLTAAWLDKKAPRVGITARFENSHAYTLKVPVNTPELEMTVYAATRNEAIREFMRKLDETRHTVQLEAATDPTFTDAGPDETDPVLPDDAPSTVDATLHALRETILLAVIAGPKVCVPGANEMLAHFGLPPVPERRKFTVTRPVTGTAYTTVDAFDEASARRVAEWRWEGEQGWHVPQDTLINAGDFEVRAD